MPTSIEDHHCHHFQTNLKFFLLCWFSIFHYNVLAISAESSTGCASVSISIVSKIIPGQNPNESTIYSNQCSATFVKFNNKPYLITAYHCIHGENDNKMASPSSISINERTGCEEYQFSKIKLKNILVHPTQMNLTVKDDFSFKTPLDIALLELDITQDEFSQFPKMQMIEDENQLFSQLAMNESNSATKISTEFYAHLNYAGYPVEPPFNFGDFKFYPEIKSFISVELKSIFLFENIYGGMSGGPVYKSKNGTNILVGIISTSIRKQDTNNFNRGESALVYGERLKNFIPIKINN